MANKRNLANGELASGISTSDTSLTLVSGQGARQANPPFKATITPANELSTLDNSEIVNVTSVSGDTLTIERGQSGTSPKTFTAGAIIANGIYVEDLDEFITSTTTNKLTVSSTAPDSPTTGDVWIDTSNLPANLAPTSIVWKEAPTGTKDGVNKEFTLSRPYISGSVQVYVNGVAKSSKVIETNNALGVITLDVAPSPTDDLSAQFQAMVSPTGNADTVDGYHANSTPTANNIPVFDSNIQIPDRNVKIAYSTNEVNTGNVWIDGKTIYRKTVSCGTLPNASTKSVALGVAGIDNVVSIKGWTTNTTGPFLPLPYVNPASTNIGVYVNKAGTGTIEFVTADNRTTYTVTYVTIEYTK